MIRNVWSHLSKIAGHILQVVSGCVLARDAIWMLRVMRKAESVFSLNVVHDISRAGAEAIRYLLLCRLFVSPHETKSCRLTGSVLKAQITCVLILAILFLVHINNILFQKYLPQ